MQAPLRLLSNEDMQALHDARCALETGMLVDHENEILAAAGALVDHDAKMVRFPPELVEARLKLVPRETIYHGRTPEYDFAMSADGPIFSRVAGGATHYYDLQTGQNRRATLADWREFCTLVDALPRIHSVATMHCGDVPAETADLYSLLTLYESQRKVIVHNAFSLKNAQLMIEMALVLRGSKKAVAERPPYRHMLSPISPLFLNEDDTGQLLLCCEYGIPTDIPIMPTAGTTSPITLAGTLVQSLAEYLGTMTLAQCARPGCMPFFVDPVVEACTSTRRSRRGRPALRRSQMGLGSTDWRRSHRAERRRPLTRPCSEGAEHHLPVWRAASW
jgi:trimethylamine--corrinoid protein Co-methyltransferase